MATVQNPFYTPRDKVRSTKKKGRLDLEARLQQQVVRYVRYQYPKIMFKCDLNGVHLTIAQYTKLKALGNTKGHPDLVFYEARHGYNGLFIELKIDKTRLFSSTGNPVTEHIREQNAYLEELRQRGYKAEFAVGFAQAKEIIDEYLKLS